jgi:hypothetical protein
VFYQRLYIMGGVQGFPWDSRSNHELELVGDSKSACCNIRAGLGVRFF